MVVPFLFKLMFAVDLSVINVLINVIEVFAVVVDVTVCVHLSHGHVVSDVGDFSAINACVTVVVVVGIFVDVAIGGALLVSTLLSLVLLLLYILESVYLLIRYYINSGCCWWS